MDKMWAGRFQKALDREADDFNSSIHFDSRMYRQDIRGSIAHAKMLLKCGILSEEDAELIVAGLTEILADLESGALQIDPAAEDIHMFVEAELTSRIGEAGKRLHTARSRNDQVAVDIRMYLRDEAEEIRGLLISLIKAVLLQAEHTKTCIMPGYTHLQRAQPVYFAHQLLAYCMMLLRDLSRLSDAVKRMNISPLGCCALAGTSYPIDREYTASLLGFDGIAVNSIDGVSDRDFCAELLSVFSIIMMHLSRFAAHFALSGDFAAKFYQKSDGAAADDSEGFLLAASILRDCYGKMEWLFAPYDAPELESAAKLLKAYKSKIRVVAAAPFSAADVSVPAGADELVRVSETNAAQMAEQMETMENVSIGSAAACVLCAMRDTALIANDKHARFVALLPD